MGLVIPSISGSDTEYREKQYSWNETLRPTMGITVLIFYLIKCLCKFISFTFSYDWNAIVEGLSSARPLLC
jgi:hypothetical protein